jgi:hypothetical protein
VLQKLEAKAESQKDFCFSFKPSLRLEIKNKLNLLNPNNRLVDTCADNSGRDF